MMNACRLLALTLLWPFSASANWQYTTWGMTPEQVQKASKGVAVETTAKERKGQSLSGAATYTAKLTAPYNTDAFQFKAYFLFDKEDKLTHVVLNLVGGSSPYDVIGALRGKYGKPDEEPKRDPMAMDWDWSSLPNGDRMYARLMFNKDLSITYTTPNKAVSQGL